MRTAANSARAMVGAPGTASCRLESLEERRLMAVTPTIRAQDPRGAPDLTVDATALYDRVLTTQTFAETHPAVVEGAVVAGKRRLLRFTTSTPNYGKGDLILGKPADHPDWFQWSPAHGHWHLNSFADYRLWTAAGWNQWKALKVANPEATSDEILAANPGVAAQMKSGRKQAFCAVDSWRYSRTAGARKYTNCITNQGISVGWSDVYSRNLDGQWVDVSGLPGGNYVLEVEVNPARFIEEMNYKNNTGAISIKLPAATASAARTAKAAKQPRAAKLPSEGVFSSASVSATPAGAGVADWLGTRKDVLTKAN